MMDDGSQDNSRKIPPWVAIPKAAARLLPVREEYREVEALFSVALDHNNDRPVSVLGYANLWKWSQGKVRRFLDRIGVEIIYPNDTSKFQKQQGKITVMARRGERRENGEIMFINFKELEESAERKRRGERRQLTRSIEKEKKDRVKDPRIPVFIKWFSEKYKRAFDREFLIGGWGKAGAQVKALLALPLSWKDLQYLVIEFLLDDDPWLAGKGHHLGTLLMRINQNAYRKYLDPEFREDNQHNIIEDPRNGNSGTAQTAPEHGHIPRLVVNEK